MAGKKILMLVGEFSEEYEIFVFEQAMHAVGHKVDVVCPDKKAGDNIKTSLHDFEGDQTYTEKPGHLYGLNKTFARVTPEEYDAVYVAGGRGPEYIRIDKRVAGYRPALPREREADLYDLPRRPGAHRGGRGRERADGLRRCNIASPRCALPAAFMSTSSRPAPASTATLSPPKVGPDLAAFMRECLKVLGTEIHHGETLKGREQKAA